MNTLVVYDTRFGDTAQIARAIADTLRERGAARLLSVQDVAAPDLEGIDLLLVGGPTHAHGVSLALRRWLDSLPEGLVRDLPVATFDTRYRMARFLSGSAARAIEGRLRHLGAGMIAPPESFFVLDSEGPLADGELARAAEWARTLAERQVGRGAGAPDALRDAPGEHWHPHP